MVRIEEPKKLYPCIGCKKVFPLNELSEIIDSDKKEVIRAKLQNKKPYFCKECLKKYT